MEFRKIGCNECPFAQEGDYGDYFCQISGAPLAAPDECLFDQWGNYVLAVIRRGGLEYVAIVPGGAFLDAMGKYGLRLWGNGVSFYGYMLLPDARSAPKPQALTLFGDVSVHWPNADSVWEIDNFVFKRVGPEF